MGAFMFAVRRYVLFKRCEIAGNRRNCYREAEQAEEGMPKFLYFFYFFDFAVNFMFVEEAPEGLGGAPAV
jgi:hypothetical protein